MISRLGSKRAGWIAGILLLVIAARLVWLFQADELVFESEITALLPTSDDSWLVQLVDDRVSAVFKNRIAMVIQGANSAATDAATDRFSDLLEQGIVQEQVMGNLVGTADFDLLSERIKAMLTYKDRLIGNRSHQRMQEPGDSQLVWRMNQVSQFPPSYITDPVTDPLGTLEEFLTERLPRIREIESDGLYLRVDVDTPTNLLLFDLAEGELGNEQANNSVRWIFDARDTVSREFDVDIYLSGIPLHATTIKERTIEEVRWMAILATILTLGIFLYVTRSTLALLISSMAIVLSIASGLVISHGITGLPHLVGLTMATTAIGICIDVSFHFWVHVRAGMSGAKAIRAIRPGINMCFLTTAIGLLAIASTSIPVLMRTAVFVCGALLASWLLALFIVPRLARKADSINSPRMSVSMLPRKVAVGLMLIIVISSIVGLSQKYYTDDSPIRLGRQTENLIADDRVVQNLLGFTRDPGIYLIQADSAETMINAEASLLGHLTEEEASQVTAVSRLVISETQQYRNQLLFKEAKNDIDMELLKTYLAMLQVPTLDWGAGSEYLYSLEWVISQPWAAIERELVLTCERSVCASMIQVQGGAMEKLDVSCQSTPECTHISFSENRIAAFQELRASLFEALLLAFISIFSIFCFRYRGRALKIITVPILASISGVAAVAWAGMPVTVFTLAALFLLVGLSVDYVIFSTETKHHATPTLLAVFASALTTSLSFWILSFSSTPAVQFFALPIAVGIPVAWISVQAIRPVHV